MNAPFQARAGLRDPFTAFVCDDATADMLRPVAVEHGWSPEKVNKGGLRNAVQSLSISASPNILFVDLSESSDPLNDINALAEVCEPGTIVIAAGHVNDVRLYRDLVSSGIHDYLLKPFTVDQLRDSFAHAQQIISGPRGEAQADKPQRRAVVKQNDKNYPAADNRDVKIVLFPFVEENREFFLADQFGKSASGGNISSGQRSKRGGVKSLCFTDARDELPVFVHQKNHFGVGFLKQTPNDFINFLKLFVVHDQRRIGHALSPCPSAIVSLKL